MKYLPIEEIKNKLSINDLLALERTSMANERTFLAYIRTALTFIVPGVTGVQLANTPLLKTVSFLFVPIGIAVFLVGAARFLKKRKISQHLVDYTLYKKEKANENTK